MSLEQHISDLLYERDCVIVPGFGAFVTSAFSAELNAATQMFMPPSHRLSFQPGLRTDDGLLRGRIARAGQNSEDVVRLQISDIVTGWHRRLHKGERVRLEDLGVFYIDREGELQFKPQVDLNFDPDTYGLGVFRATPLLILEDEVHPRVIPLHKRPERRRAPMWRTAAVAAGVAGLLFIGGVKSDLQVQSYFAGFDLDRWSESFFGSDETPAVTPSATPPRGETGESAGAVENKVVPEAETAVEGSAAEVAKPAAVPEVEVNITPVEISAVQSGKYYVVVGSFTEKSNADNLYRELRSRGYDPAVLPNDGRYNKVAVAAFDQRSDAVQALRRYKSEVQRSAWIYRK